MTAKVVSVAPETTLREVADLLVRHDISGVPVVAGERLVGVVSEADVVEKERGPVDPPPRRFERLRRPRAFAARKLNAVRAVDAMSSPPVTIEPWVSIWGAAATIVEHDVNRLPVVDRGRMMGIVTRHDLVRAFVRADSEIEREIREQVLPSLEIGQDAVEIRVHRGDVRLTETLEHDVAVTLHRAVQRVVGVQRVHEERARTEPVAA